MSSNFTNTTGTMHYQDPTREASIPVVEAVTVGESQFAYESLQRELEEERHARLQAERRLAAYAEFFPLEEQQHAQQPQEQQQAQQLEEEQRAGLQRDRATAVGAVVTFFLLALIAIIVGIQGKTNLPFAPRPAPRPTPTQTSSPRSREIVSFVNSITLSGRTLTYPNSNSIPEEEALNWMIEDDHGTREANELKLRQRYALATIWFANGLFESDHLNNWLTSTDECGWDGIFCLGGEVRVVLLDADGLNGRMPSDLALLKTLTWLGLGDNRLTGSIPTEIGLLTALRRFDLSINQLMGTIPTELNQLTVLKQFFVYNNTVSGNMPFCDGATRPTRFNVLVSDCNEVSCPCCTRCCPIGGFEGIPSSDSFGSRCDA